VYGAYLRDIGFWGRPSLLVNKRVFGLGRQWGYSNGESSKARGEKILGEIDSGMVLPIGVERVSGEGIKSFFDEKRRKKNGEK